MRERRLEELERALREVCQSLMRADPDIRAIVQFGSSVYLPEEAEDVDLLVLSGSPKPIGVYLTAVEGFPVPVHVVPAKAGRKLEPLLAASVRAWGRVIAGDPEEVERAVEGVPPPSLKEVEEALSAAEASVEAARDGEGLAYFLIRAGLHSLAEATKKGALLALCSARRANGEVVRKFVGIVRNLWPFLKGSRPPEECLRALESLLPEVRKLVEMAAERAREAERGERGRGE